MLDMEDEIERYLPSQSSWSHRRNRQKVTLVSFQDGIVGVERGTQLARPLGNWQVCELPPPPNSSLGTDTP